MPFRRNSRSAALPEEERVTIPSNEGRVMSPLSPSSVANIREITGNPVKGSKDRLEKAIDSIDAATRYIRQYQGPLKFQDDFKCRYCGSVSMGVLRQGLSPKERRSVATIAVSKIGKLSIKQQEMVLQISDKGMTGVVTKKGNTVFFEGADDIQYLLSGRKNTKNSQSTYILLFGRSQGNGSVITPVHLLRFSSRNEAMRLYNSVKRMIRDNMFSTLFDINDETEQEEFNPDKIQSLMSAADSNIEKHMAETLATAMDKIDNLLSGNEESIGRRESWDPVARQARRNSENVSREPSSDRRASVFSPGLEDMMNEKCSLNESDYIDIANGVC